MCSSVDSRFPCARVIWFGVPPTKRLRQRPGKACVGRETQAGRLCDGSCFSFAPPRLAVATPIRRTFLLLGLPDRSMRWQLKEAGAGIEPANSGFADRDLTTWLPRRELSERKLSGARSDCQCSTAVCDSMFVDRCNDLIFDYLTIQRI